MGSHRAAQVAGHACDDCALAAGNHCCGGGAGQSLLRSDRVVLTLAGIVGAVLTLAALTVPSSRHAVVLVPGGVTLLTVVVLAALGTVSVRRTGPSADRAAEAALRILPLVVLGVFVTIGAAVVRLFAG